MNRNYAFIDSQNVHFGVKLLGWDLDWKKFRVYLKEKYKVGVAFIFIGYIKSNQRLYSHLQNCGYILIFKPVVFDEQSKAKGNCDADLIVQSLIDKEKYEKAVIVTGDGDFYSLVRYLYETNKLSAVLSPNERKRRCILYLI